MITISINNRKFTGFVDYQIELKFNSIASSFSFNAKQDLLRGILDYSNVQIKDSQLGLLITGTALAPTLRSSAKPEAIQVPGYAKTGVLEDCSIPVELFPLQFDNLSLAEITTKLLEPFGLNYVFDQSNPGLFKDLNLTYEKVTAEPGQTIKEYLNKLASQRGIILSHDSLGNLLYTRLDVNRVQPVAHFSVGNYGIKSMDLNINAQLLHSEITVMKQASVNNPDAGEFTIDNPYVNKFRPMVRTIDSGDIFDIQRAARYELSNEMSNIKLTFESTKFYRPGNLIWVTNPELKIKNKSVFFIESVMITGTSKETDNYSYTCVPRDVYTDTPPINIFR